MTTAVETDPTVSPTNTAMEQAVPSWVDSISDPEVLGYIQKKGWSAPADIVQGYRNLEKLVGNEKVPLPKGEQDAEGWERVFTALGRPTSPDAYKLPDSDAAAKFHEVGLNTRQAEALSGWLGESREHAAKTAAEEAASKVSVRQTPSIGVTADGRGSLRERHQPRPCYPPTKCRIIRRSFGVSATRGESTSPLPGPAFD
jgi:hypothetical protein